MANVPGRSKNPHLSFSFSNLYLTNLLPSLKSCIYISLHQLFSSSFVFFHFLSLFAPRSLLTLSINSLSTPQSHFNICHERMLHILPTWSLCPGASSDMAGVICCGRQTVWTCHHDGMERYWVYLCQTQAGHGSKSLRSHDSETAKWEWGHFLCKEIKVKRKIKVWFPASWFVFSTEIPFFLSDFAETTIAPLPVLVTMTPLTPSLGGTALLHLPQSGRLPAALWFYVEIQ